MMIDISNIPEVDSSRASIARVYDYSLGGKDNFDADRRALEAILEVAPHQSDVSQMNRRWLERVVAHLADRVGMDQFLDLGSGLPTAENTHDVAQRHNGDARVVYVDNDPSCVAHGHALLESNPNTFFVGADFTKPSELLANPEISKRLELDRPLVLMQVGTLHHVTDEQDPAGIMAEYLDALPRGSYVAITHFWNPGEEDLQLAEKARELQVAFTELGLGSGYYRPRTRIRELFGSLEMLEPGLVGLDDWWPGGPRVRPPWPEEQLILGGVARKN